MWRRSNTYVYTFNAWLHMPIFKGFRNSQRSFTGKNKGVCNCQRKFGKVCSRKSIFQTLRDCLLFFSNGWNCLKKSLFNKIISFLNLVFIFQYLLCWKKWSQTLSVCIETDQVYGRFSAEFKESLFKELKKNCKTSRISNDFQNWYS